MAGGTLPDCFGMVAQQKGDYATKGAMTPLKEYVDRGLIDIKDFSKGAIDAGSYDGVFYMVTFGDTASTLVYNMRILKDAGYRRAREPDELRRAEGLPGRPAGQAPQGSLG